MGIETQDVYLGKKKTWTRKIIILTDGENPIEVEDWEATVKKMSALDILLTVVCVLPTRQQPLLLIKFDNSGIDFDDEEVPFKEDDKSSIKVCSSLALSPPKSNQA